MIKGSKMGSQGVFLDEPTDIPVEVADYLAKQLGIEEASVPKACGERENTRLDHVRELWRREYREFAEVDPGARPQPGSLALHGSSGSIGPPRSRGRRTRYGRVGPAAARRR
ncbi:DUF4158 domain-containing protein [Streptomyces sp. WAC 06725]|uniref:DUF4158 domain-containing protein n=1 Tax=Streptomyces sp. WAC 06725 TaxID=2203209 RepID=UPI0021AD6667|nr:DUF4158 domain-containing protein [Streptomyces sp. WAC 06725]